MILATPLDAPPAGERRHLVRVRARGEGGSAWWAVRLATGQLVAGAAGFFGSSPETIIGSWQSGAPHDGPTVLSCYVAGQSDNVRIIELFLDVDTRAAPTFTPQILDGSGTPTTTITDTVTPTARVSALNLDGLPARQYRYWVTDASSTIVWDTGVVSGPAVDRLITPLDNGAYTLHQQVWSTLGANTAYASVIEELTFTMVVGAVPAPNPPVVTPEEPFYRVKVCAPNTTGFDDHVAWLQLQRVDCPHGSQRATTTIAILGPLETDQCAEWVDFTIPRSGVGRTCDHDPEPCCSYYRARTVGRVEGSILVSSWSDAFNPGVPAGLIFAWPDTESSIPFGWSRVTALDSRYPKGIPTAGTQPGNTGGSATHSHTTPGHTHTLDHSHSQSAGTTGSSSASQTFGGSGVGAGTTHTHSLPTTNTTTADVSSQSAAPGSSAVPNDPARLEVIWIESNGAPLGVPDGALGLFPDIAPAGWDTYADATGRFLKGAAPAGDGGATAASELDNHAHTIDSHTHLGTPHTHISDSTGPREGSIPDGIGGSGNPRVSNVHVHPVIVNSGATANLQSASGGTSGPASPNDPPFRNLRVRQNVSGSPSLPLGIIGLWLGSLDTIPDGWQLCDGTNGTPNMLGLYPRGDASNIGGTGGGTAGHTHTGGTHTHDTTGHSHSRSIVAAAQSQEAQSGSTPFYSSAHTHSISNTDSATPDVGSSGTGTLLSTTTEPAHREVAFIQFQAEPEPPPEPETFCLEWSEDEHLIRTYGPDGPMYFGVWGMFEWGVERPFTAATGVMGSRFVTSAPPGGRNLRMVTAVESEAELAALRAILARPLVLISPSDSTETWAAPVAESIRVVKIGRIREVRAEFIATGPEPEPQVADVGV